MVSEYFDWLGQQKRVDYVGTRTGKNEGPVSTTLLSYGTPDGGVLTIVVDWLRQTCENITTNHTFEMEGVPQGFLILNGTDDEVIWWYENLGNPGIGSSKIFITVEETDVQGVVLPQMFELYNNTGNQGMTNTVIKGVTYYIEQVVPAWFHFIFPEFCFV